MKGSTVYCNTCHTITLYFMYIIIYVTCYVYGMVIDLHGVYDSEEDSHTSGRFPHSGLVPSLLTDGHPARENGMGLASHATENGPPNAT
jgi:hypothetical protein